jgi:hypothetical protein
MLWHWFQQLRQLWSQLNPLFSRLWNFLTDFKKHTLGIFDDATQLIQDVRDEIDAIQNFKMNPRWNSRVISAPKAFNLLQTTLPNLISDFVDQVKGLITDLRTKIEPQEINIDDIEGLEKVPAKLVRAAEKFLAWLFLIIDTLTTIEQVIQELSALVDDIRQFREAIENLDGLFLSQSNPRRTITVRERARIRPT